MTRVKITDAEIIARYKAGSSMRNIPANYERVRQVLREAGVPLRHGGPGPNPDVTRRNEAIAEGYKAGQAVGTLARQYKCSNKTVYRVLQWYGLRNRIKPVVSLPEPETPPVPKVPPPVLYDPEQARTRLRARLVERANARKIAAWEQAA